MSTTLTAGDIAFSAFQSDNSGGSFDGDAFEFVLLVPVTAGTTIFFTDNGYRTDTSRFRTNENVVRWVAQANLPAGTIKTFTNPSGNSVPSTAEWTGINPANGTSLTNAQLGLANGGDNITALQNPTFGGTDLLNGTAIAAITFGGANFAATFTATSGNATTALAPGLTDGVNAVSLAVTDNGRYNDAATGSVESGTQTVVRASLNNDAYWTTSTTPLSPSNTTATFVILPSVNLSVSSNTGTETGQTVITVTATASSAVSGNQTVSLGVSGTGITPGDYNLSNSTITILNGQTSGSATFTVVDDALVEDSETAVLTISNPSSGIFLGNTITQNINITDNDFNNITGSGRTDITGTANNDRIVGGIGGKSITSGVGNDIFVYTSRREVGHRITDFAVGSDKIDFSQLGSSLTGYTSSNAISGGYVQFVQGSLGAGSTMIRIDPDGTGGLATDRPFLQINNVAVADMNNANNFIF